MAGDLMEGGKPPRDCKQSLRPYKSLIALHSALFFSSHENHKKKPVDFLDGFQPCIGLFQV